MCLKLKTNVLSFGLTKWTAVLLFTRATRLTLLLKTSILLRQLHSKMTEWWTWRYLPVKEKNICCFIYFWWFPDFWILYADVSTHSACSIFMSRMKMEHAECTETSTYKIQTQGNHQKRKNTILTTRRKLETNKENICAIKWFCYRVNCHTSWE
jgi:hypothetical protein